MCLTCLTFALPWYRRLGSCEVNGHKGKIAKNTVLPYLPYLFFV